MKTVIQPKYLKDFPSKAEIQKMIEDHRKRIAPQEELMAKIKAMVHINHYSQEVFDA